MRSSPPPYSPGLTPADISHAPPAPAEEPPDAAAVDTRTLHPRVAVLLDINSHWHKWLFFCRLLSVVPELRFGIPLLWTILKRLLILRGATSTVDGTTPVELQRRLIAAELVLAPIWVRSLLSLNLYGAEQTELIIQSAQQQAISRSSARTAS